MGAIELSIEVKVPTALPTSAQAEKIMAEELVKATEEGLMVIQGAVLPLTPVDQGLLRGGFQTQILGEPAGVLGRLFNPMAHALPQEAGAKPHWPPLAAIEGWVRRKLQVPAGEVRSVAYRIARAISVRGLPAREFAKRGFEASKSRVLARFEQANATIAKRLLGMS